MQQSRRHFIFATTALIAVAPLYWIWNKLAPKNNTLIPGRMLGASHKRGHNIFKMVFGKSTSTTAVGTVIIGGGISGLSAARQLSKNNDNDFVLLELEDIVGGNARYEQNKTGKFPLGAHYLPIPSPDNSDLIQLLLEIGLITHIDAQGLPHYNERNLCHDPDERLFINSHWQDGIVPHFGVPKAEVAQIQTFLSLMAHYKTAKGKDGKYAFDLPIDKSSVDNEFRSLDKISMKAFLDNNQLDSPHLYWYVAYCCKDDFGTELVETSAWAGIHYFAARRGVAGNVKDDQILTWPEGNGYLVEKLSADVRQNIKCGSMAFAVHQAADGYYKVSYIDYDSNSVKELVAKNVVFSCPQSILKHIKTNIKALKNRSLSEFEYSTWVTINAEIDASKAVERKGAPLSWDNVIFGSQSLGYINSSNQNMTLYQNTYNFSWYYLFPFADKSTRKNVLKMQKEELIQLMATDMTKVYKGFMDMVLTCDVSVWGHGMIKPKVGFIWGSERAKACEPINGSLFFAHTDLSGMSLFEEGFYRGTQVANALLKSKPSV